MELYTSVSYELAEQLTKRYSTSFSKSSTLFPPSMRKQIYAIYGLVRVADEVVDTYRGEDARAQLKKLQDDVAESLLNTYSVNPIIHAFAQTAHRYGIDDRLIRPFFESMNMDTETINLDMNQYQTYIYGSAEVIGLMCLRVFVDGDDEEYQALAPGAQKLGSAYQKVNFLRDIGADYRQLNRQYFPGVDYEQFNETDKNAIIADIENDFAVAKTYIAQLPVSARGAVKTSYLYYSRLLDLLKDTPADTIMNNRLSVSKWEKIYLYAKARWTS